MVDLSDLPYALLVEIARRLKELEDFTSFRSVSKSLRSATKEEDFQGLRFRQHTPYLMLPVRDDGPDDIRELYCLVDGESIVASVKVANFKSKKCLESLGWLLVSGLDGSMSLLEPFAGTEIPLPHQNTFPEYEWVEMDELVFVDKMVLSARPNGNPDFVLMIIAGGLGHLAFWRLGDKGWNRIEDRLGRYRDVVYHGGQFYAFCYQTAWVFNLVGKDNEIDGHIVTYLIPENEPRDYKRTFYNPLMDSRNIYVVKVVDDSLLIITRKIEDLSPDGFSYMTSKFQVYEVDIETGKWEEIFSLGTTAIFLGHNSTMAIDTSRFSGGGVIKGNHIYFTDDNSRVYYVDGPKGGGMDTGVYNFETGTIEPVYPGEVLLSKVSPSTWITPCS